MNLRPIYGHEALLHRLAGALASSRFPQAALLTGAAGVGKQRIALWVAQGLLCEGGPCEPCGECAACRQALGLTHPDLHWYVPIPRPKAGTAEKQVEQAAEALGEVMEERRAGPLYSRPGGMASHSLASIRLLQRVVALTPFQGKRKVVILGDAERLVVQEASQEAANALLKVLEEPPANTVVLLTSSEPQGLLPTIRSRLVPIRVGRVRDEDVSAFLEREMDPPVKGAALKRRTLMAAGSIGRAIWNTEGGDDADRAAERLLEAIEKGPSAWAPRALSQAPWAARGDFSAMLDALAVRLRDRLVECAESGEPVERQLDALRIVEETRTRAQGNVNPQLALAVLAGDLEHLR
jgi:DNA polymerase-3 subunit delta'